MTMAGVVRSIKTPLTLAGFALLIFYSVAKLVVPLLTIQSEGHSYEIIQRILGYIFILSMTSIALGLASYILSQVLPKPRRSHLQVSHIGVTGGDYEGKQQQGRLLVTPKAKKRSSK